MTDDSAEPDVRAFCVKSRCGLSAVFRCAVYKCPQRAVRGLLTPHDDLFLNVIYGPAEREIAETITSFKFDTIAYDECYSSCADIFMAGKSRRVTSDAKLGFHRPCVTANEEKAYYEYARDGHGWQEEFDYVPHIYDVALTDMLDIVEYMTSRSIALDFILEAYSHSSYEMWEPEHSRLLEAGVVTSLDYVDFDDHGDR